MKNTATLIDRINKFDYYYEMSDDSRKYDAGLAEEKAIRSELEELNREDLIDVQDNVTPSQDSLNRYFEEFFMSQPEEVKEETQETTMRSQVFSTAWNLFKTETFTSFAKALRAAWKKFKLVKQLRNGIAYFSFTKANGELREAIGTLLAPNFTYTMKGSQKPEKPELVKYWDIQSRGWRSCRVDRLVA